MQYVLSLIISSSHIKVLDWQKKEREKEKDEQFFFFDHFRLALEQFLLLLSLLLLLQTGAAYIRKVVNACGHYAVLQNYVNTNTVDWSCHLVFTLSLKYKGPALLRAHCFRSSLHMGYTNDQNISKVSEVMLIILCIYRLLVIVMAFHDNTQEQLAITLFMARMVSFCLVRNCNAYLRYNCFSC